jgi:hypothetical protein
MHWPSSVSTRTRNATKNRCSGSQESPDRDHEQIHGGAYTNDNAPAKILNASPLSRQPYQLIDMFCFHRSFLLHISLLIYLFLVPYIVWSRSPEKHILIIPSIYVMSYVRCLNSKTKRTQQHNTHTHSNTINAHHKHTHSIPEFDISFD